MRLGHGTVGEAFSVPFPGVTRGVPAFSVQVGNPHAVLDGSHLGARLEDVPLASVAEAVLATGRFPAGVNVEVAEVHGDHVRARVFERGVGETQACGTGAAAIAAVAIEHLGLGAPVRVHMPGGVLVVHQAADGKGGRRPGPLVVRACPPRGHPGGPPRRALRGLSRNENLALGVGF